MGHPTFEEVRRLADWQPPLGVISVYLRLDPGDRGGAWRTELRNGLAAILDAAKDRDHETRAALRATAERIGERFANHDRGLPRGEVRFAEVAAGSGGERWWSTHLPPESAVTACFAERPVIAPLLCLCERGAPRGVAVVSAERVRLLEWAPGSLDAIEDWELSMFSRDWRERKAQRVNDPAHAQAVSASGRDQWGERLDENRQRFLGECGRLAAGIGAERGWPRLLVFGAAEHGRDFGQSAAVSPAPPVETADESDLISVPDGKLEARVEEAVERLTRQRERGLVERALEHAHGGDRGTAGPQETLAALAEGRVDHLVLDAARAAEACSRPVLPPGEASAEDGVASEALARRALASAARVSTVFGDAAEMLSPADGVAAVLRY